MMKLHGEIRNEAGRCWVAKIDPAGCAFSRSELLEDGEALGPGNSEHRTIRLIGGGSWALSDGQVYFSSSDNSDPLRNGRRYELVCGDTSLVLIRGAAHPRRVRAAIERYSSGRPILCRRILSSEEEVVEAIYSLSMLWRPAIETLRRMARSSQGAILEIGAYIGGSTCALADAVRGSNRKIISVEVGGQTEGHPSLPSSDILADLRANLEAWDLTESVTVIDDWLHRATTRIERALAGKKIGFLFIDADGKIAEHMHLLAPFLADDCVLAFDDYDDELKGAGVRSWVSRALDVGAAEEIAEEPGGLWFGRLHGNPESIPVRPFVSNGGKCYLSAALAGRSLEANFDAGSVQLLEDGKSLGPGNAVHADIRALGGGRFSMWGDALYMSSSDNSDPNLNGKRYEAIIGDLTVPLNFWRRLGRDIFPKTIVLGGEQPKSAALSARRFDSPLFDDYAEMLAAPPCPQAPVNLRNRSDAEIQGAVDYALRVGDVAKQVLKGAGISAEGTILEIGPGWDFGAAMLLGEDARRLIVADRFLAAWQESFHPEVYRRLRSSLGRPSRYLDAVIDSNGYEGAIETLAEPSYALTSIGDGEVDVVYSNAVLEHVHPLDAAARELFRITRRGGWGVHQIDLRYHRSFEMPLEHLLMSREEFARILDLTHCEVGCQTRLGEAASIFKTAGFNVVRVDPNMEAPEAYLAEFIGRLRRDAISPYRDWPEDDLRAISGRIFVRKP